ncbi:Saposin B domain-containing protein [Strongyloides ratti]|uniref:Saposin B domain-containing protein n=1 Tax=Strongyloides ratti TaxID=34506 RepID=A0A090LC16_STRRB|nr:Saposin B domain-containing protein [Strongyloides ratti]CEF67302.1 Saposin B domain-containing protein [Strongyloides ratti]
MFRFSIALILFLSNLNILSYGNRNYYNECKLEVINAQKIFVNMINERIKIEKSKREERIENFLKNTKPFDDDVTTASTPQPPDCPYLPNATIFPNPSVSSNLNNQQEQLFSKFIIPNFLNVPVGEDPFVFYLEKLHSYIQDIEGICNGPEFKGFDSVTDKQVLGFLGVLSINHANHVCPICQKFTQHIRSIIEPTLLTVSDKSSLHIIHYLYQQIPENDGLCSILLPGCHEQLSKNSTVGTRATKCLECPLCMTGTTVLEHTVFFNQQFVTEAHSFLNASIFHNICSELCNMGPTSLFPNGVSYSTCRNSMSEFYIFIINALKNILIPNNFCSLETDACKPGETPNILTCLQDLCLDGLPKIMQDICKVIPSDPTEAAYFIGLKQKPEDDKKQRQMIRDMLKSEL